ncbi:embryo-specific protein ATS3A-like [Silene latifolia]|uniref:embryo-specific protein ATS3A-like n=1 Tax=Silene latifolia TaxID=37657 RepID=UPI003D77C887
MRKQYCILMISVISLIIFKASASSLSSKDTHTFPSTTTLPLLFLRIKPNQAASTCSFRVQITTSCSSVSSTRDQISLSFGDAYGNQVYVPRIDDPYSGTFEACSTDTFDISGPCTYDVCYVYLYRRGYDGWNVGSVRISSPYIRTVTFNYRGWLPSDVWWGFNYCNGVSASPKL